MSNPLNVLFRTCFLAMAFTLAACDLNPVPPLKLGTNVWTGYETFYLARSLGIYHQKAVKLVELPSATEVSHAFRHHLIDVAALTLDEALVLAQYQPDIRIILVIDISNGGDVLLARPEITHLEDMKGRRIGVENTAVGAILLDGALTAANLTVADIKLVPLSIDEHLQAYMEKKVDVVVSFEPVRTQLLEAGATQLFDSSQIPDRIVDVLVTRQEVIEKRELELRRLISGYFSALKYFRQNGEDATMRMAPRLMVDPSAVMTQFEGLVLPDKKDNLRLISGLEPELKISLQALITLMLERKLLEQMVNADSLLDDRFISEKGVR